MNHIGEIPPGRQSGYPAVMKFALDRAFAALSLLVLFAPMAFIALLIRASMGSPVFFSQPRAGRNGQKFTLWKFRTMRNPHDASGRLLSDQERLTRLGRFLRSASLDELPQLWNVLRGDLSLVGPRPLLVDYLPLYSATQRRRHDVMPGITGWAQVNGRNAIDWEEKFSLDVWYVDHWNLFLDLRILARTAVCVILRTGIAHGGEATMPFFHGSRETHASEKLPGRAEKESSRDQHQGHTLESHRARREQDARLIVFSGTDCSGKSTQISLLIDRLTERGRKPVYFWSRVGYTPLFNGFKALLRRVVGKARLPEGDSPQRDRFLAGGWTRSLWLWFAFADMILQTAIRLRLLRLLGRIIVCDRYIDDSENDLKMNFGESVTRLPGWRLVKAMAAKPDVSILLDLPFEDALHRSILKNEPFADSAERRLRRAGLYKTMRESGRYEVIDAQRSIEEIAATVDSIVFVDSSSRKGDGVAMIGHSQPAQKRPTAG